MRICFVPIDNRPVCYDLAKLCAEIDESIEILLPEKKLLGSLAQNADFAAILDWMDGLENIDSIVLSLDTVTYGGLISSRRSDVKIEELFCRCEALKNILKKKSAKIYAFSSIMRISNNNINEEEKPYWDKYGKKIFDYSYHTHKNNAESCIAATIPSEILDDYLATRNRNFKINELFLQWQREGIFETLIFSKDDCAEYGLNVIEANSLKAQGAVVKTGADEIPLTLLSNAVGNKNSVSVIFSEPEHVDKISNYEDIPIENCVKSQLELAGLDICDDKNADIMLYVNNFRDCQGEIVMERDTSSFDGVVDKFSTPFMVADVRWANGADNPFVEAVLSQFTSDLFFGFSAWNTSANSLGSLICAAKIKLNAKKYNHRAFLKLQLTRLLDDWAYQANVRQKITSPDVQQVTEMMKPFENELKSLFGLDFRVSYNFPWNRKFEIGMDIKWV